MRHVPLGITSHSLRELSATQQSFRAALQELSEIKQGRGYHISGLDHLYKLIYTHETQNVFS